MSSYINLFIKSELTCIPRLLSKYLGNYYNNALCNGSTWVFGMWCILHAIFDKFVDAFLKKLKYKEYIRIRLKNSLWYLGFYGTALIYCGATLSKNEVELFNFKRMHVPSNSNLPTQVILGYTLISTFYLHSCLWEGLKKGYIISMFNYLFLFLFMLSSYILRVVEISFTLTALISVAQVDLEFTRCCLMSSVQESFLSKLVVWTFCVITFIIYLAIHIVVIPLTFILPLGLKISTDYPNIMLLFLFLNLVSWILTEIYQSIIFKFIDHWLYHNHEKSEIGENTEILDAHEVVQCCGSLLECSLFLPRDDISYNLKLVRKEIQARKKRLQAMRKPKNMFLQTLKWMVAVKRKLNDKRNPDSSDSEESEKSENSENYKNNNGIFDDESDIEDSDNDIAMTRKIDTDDEVTELSDNDDKKDVIKINKDISLSN